MDNRSTRALPLYLYVYWEDIPTDFNGIEYKQFIEMASDSTLQLTFIKLPVVKFL